MKSIITLIMSLLAFVNAISNISVYNGDLTFESDGYSMSIEIKVVSLPFEGVTNPGQAVEGRYDSLFNGGIHKRFSGGNTYSYPMYYHKYSIGATQHVILSSCMVEDVQQNSNDVWGFAKYKITIVVSTIPAEVFYFYWNSLDTAYGKFINPVYYYRDWFFSYSDTLNGIILRGGSTYYDTLYLNENGKEYKPWEVLLNRSTPVGRNFYARTTPFGITPEAITDYFHPINELILGTTVILDTVYNNKGSSDRKGYNTIDSNGGGQNFYYYYSHPPINYDFGTNEVGNTFCTPATIDLETLLGLNIIVQNGDTLVLRKRKKLWISGVEVGSLGGDSLFFKSGSKLILEQNAEIFTCFKGGLVFESGASTSWNNSSCVRAFPNSGFIFSGIHTVNNGGFMVIDGNATLKLGDSTILTFDGVNTYLDLKTNSQVILGQNAKLVFKNGAYLNAHGATFNSYNNSSLWEGIVFENSGRDSVVNCTFSNAVTSLKILNSNSYAAQLRLIKNNTFNVPSGGKYGVYAQNCFNINLQDNIFNMPSTSGSYVGAYFYNNLTGAITFEQGEGAGDDGTMFNIVHNTFNNGNTSLMIDNATSNFLPYYISKNNFYNSSLHNLILLKANGTIKNNNFTSLSKGIIVFNSSPNLSGNVITSHGISIHTAGYSYPNLSPVRDDNHLIWYGGQNHLESDTSDNIHSFSGGNIYTDFGHNLFITEETANYHITDTLILPFMYIKRGRIAGFRS